MCHSEVLGMGDLIVANMALRSRTGCWNVEHWPTKLLCREWVYFGCRKVKRPKQHNAVFLGYWWAARHTIFGRRGWTYDQQQNGKIWKNNYPHRHATVLSFTCFALVLAEQLHGFSRWRLLSLTRATSTTRRLRGEKKSCCAAWRLPRFATAGWRHFFIFCPCA